MEMRPTIQILGMIKAMTEVVLPAVDPEHKMAQEQARLVIGMLQLMQQQLPLQFRYDRHELDRYVTLSAQLLQQLQGGARTQDAMTELSASAAEGARVLDRARAEPGELESAVFELRAKVGALVQAAGADGEPSAQEAVKKLILDAAQEQLERERSWLISLGYEADPSLVPPIERLIGGSPGS